MQSKKAWGWILGVVYIVAVAIIWIAASYVVQSVVESGISPFLITYICNSLFVVYLPIVEIARYWEDSLKNLWFKHGSSNGNEEIFGDSEKVSLLRKDGSHLTKDCVSPSVLSDSAQGTHYLCLDEESELCELPDQANSSKQPGTADFNDSTNQLDSKGRWTRTRVAKISLLISPFWFLAQLTFNLSLKYTTVTSNTILSSASSLFTFLVSLGFLEEKFTWVKLISVLLCMAGTIMVSLGDSASGLKAVSSNLLLGDVFALVSAGLYAIYITLIRKKLPNEEKGEGQASMAQFLGFLGLFNFLIFLPVALVLNFTKLEPFYKLSWNQFGIIIGKGLIDNVLSDYLWAKAVLLTSTTVATAGLTIQVPLAAIVDSATGHAPHLMDYLGGFAVMVGFTGINIPSDSCSPSSVAQKLELEEENIDVVDSACHLLVSKVDTSIS